MKTIFPAIAVGFVVAAAPAPAEAETIHLTCSGHWTAIEHNVVNQQIDGHSFLVDLDRRAVGGSLGDFAISDVTDSMVSFQAPFVENGATTGTLAGRIDRISGRANLAASRDGGTNFVVVYQLDCQRTKPLF